MDVNELKNKILPYLEHLIEFSFQNNLNLHTSIGGKYAELFVATELWKHEPKLAGERERIKEVKNPKSCDLVLVKTKKKIEVKWGMLHYSKDDPFVKGSQGIPFWGWNFSSGKQFINNRFDYCILLAAKKDQACPQHVFVIECKEMNKKEMGGKRRSGVYSEGFYIEFSHDKEFYFRRKWWPNGFSPLEEKLFKDRKKYKKRWSQLKERGILE